MSKRDSRPVATTKYTSKKTGAIYTCLFSRPARVIAFLGLFLVATFATTALPIFTKTAAAQTAGVYVDSDVAADVRAAALRTAIAACFDKQGSIGNNSVSDIANGNWFTISDTVAVTALVDGTDEQRECRTGDLVPKALDAFGWPEGQRLEAACEMDVIRRENNSDCVTGSGGITANGNFNEDERSAYYRAVDNKRFNGNFSWTDPMYYILYARSMEIGCRANPVVRYADATNDQKALADNSDMYWTMDVVGRDGEVHNVIYHSSDEDEGKRDSDVTTTVTPNAFDRNHYTCIQLAEMANDYAEAYAEYVQANPPADDDPGEGGDTGGPGENTTTCAVEGIGWIVCPVMTFMATIVDYSYGVVANFLEVQPVSTDTTGPLFQAWAAMRNIANVAFVIVFLLIIYSQITSVGISNYNIKRMLPRLIIAAILVNISYWICAIAVDLSNILGASIKDVFDGVADDLYTTGESLEDVVPGGQWSSLVLVALGATAVVYAGISVLLPFILGALISVITALIILALRQALIIILIVISPLAFVAFLLPNTQSLFDKWRKLFQTLLLMFPIIGIIFGGSQLAGQIIQQNADDNDWFLQALALAVTMVPLFVTVLITKLITWMGGTLGKLAGMVNNPNRGPIDRLKRGAEGLRDRDQMRRGIRSLSGGKGNKYFGSGRYKRRAKREAISAGVESEYKRAQTGYVAEKTKSSETFRNRLAGGELGGPAPSPEAMSRAMANAINVQASLEAEEVKAEHAIIKDANLDNDINKLQELAVNGVTKYTDKNGRTQELKAAPGSSLQTAAIQRQFEIGDIEKTDELVARSGNMGVQQRQAIADGMGKLSGKAKYYGGAASAEVAAGNIKSEADLNKLVADSVKGEKWSAQNLVQSDKATLTRLSQVVTDPGAVDLSNQPLNPASIDKLRNAAEQVSTDPMISEPEARIMERIQAIDHGVPFPSK